MTEPKTTSVSLKNEAPGVRWVHTLDGRVDIAPGQTLGPVEVLEAELEGLPEGVFVVTEPETPAVSVDVDDDEGVGVGVGVGGGVGDAAQFIVPEDLADNTKSDGLKLKDDILTIAKAEEVTLDGSETKADLVAKIIAKRAATPAE